MDPDGLAELIAQSIFSFTVTDEYLDKYYQDDLPAKFMNAARQKAIVLGGAARALETVGEVALSRLGGDALSAVTDTIGVIKSVNPKRGLSINDWDPGDTVSVIGLLIAAEPSDNVNWDYAIEQYYRWDSGGSGRSGSQSLHIDTELFTKHDGYFSSNHDLLAYNGYFPFTLHRKLDFLTRQGAFRERTLGGQRNEAPLTNAMPY